EAALDSTVEIAFVAAFPIEAEQRIDVGVRDRPAVGAPGQRCENPPGARRLVRLGGRAADEDPLPGRRLHARAAAEGSGDGERVDARHLALTPARRLAYLSIQ